MRRLFRGYLLQVDEAAQDFGQLNGRDRRQNLEPAPHSKPLGQAGSRRLTFNSCNGVSNALQGKVVTIHPPQRQTAVSLFFTKEHAEYWLTKASEEDLL